MNNQISFLHAQEIIYHIYPLGYAGLIRTNDSTTVQDQPACCPLQQITNDLSRLQSLGITVLYIGPVFSSEHHGYDTIDYTKIDERLGSNNDFKHLVQEAHQLGINVILDTVFNHVSRSFPYFRDLLNNKWDSKYKDWFMGINFNTNNPYNDGFDYQTWDGHYELVKFNLKNPSVSEYLINTALFWISEFDIDGLRIDAADVMDTGFLRSMAESCRDKKKDFFIVGEQVHGMYHRLLDDALMDSVTNYECYKGFYSSLNDGNYHEISYALNRQFGEQDGLYKHKSLFNFVDNHDVDRVASILSEYAHVYPLYLLLFTIPGIPVLYYGDEYGAKGKRSKWSDVELRKSMASILQDSDYDLYRHITKMIEIRKSNLPLILGTYKNIYIAARQFCFLREYEQKKIYCYLNSDMEAATAPSPTAGVYQDILNNEVLTVDKTISLYPCWGRILIPVVNSKNNAIDESIAKNDIDNNILNNND